MSVDRTPNGKWKASVVHKGNRYHVGVFGSHEAASSAADIEYARLDDGSSPLIHGGAVMTTVDYAQRLGVRYGTMKRWISEGMPVTKFGNTVRIDPAIADAWVREHRADSVSFQRASLIYCVQRSSDDAIKIGWTSDLERRLRELRRDTGVDIGLLAAFPGDKPDELRLHDRFSSDRIDGEWFRKSERVLEWLNNVGRSAA